MKYSSSILKVYMTDISPQQDLLRDWELVFKKSQLSFWLLIALTDAPRHLGQIVEYMKQAGVGHMTTNKQVLYRALRRLKDTGLVAFTLRAGKQGPDVKQYYITLEGSAVLRAFVERNILPIVMSSVVKELIEESATYASNQVNGDGDDDRAIVLL